MESRKYCLVVTNLSIMFTLNILKNYNPFLDVCGLGKFVKYLIERIRIITQTYLVWEMLHKNINKCAFSPFVELKILLTLHCLVYCVRIVLSIPFLETGRYFCFTVFLFRSHDIGGKMRPADPIAFVGPLIWSGGKSVVF